MTREEKQLLLKDLCARLPYGVIVDYKENEFETPHWKITTIYPDTFNGWIGYDKRVGAGSESGSRPFKIGEVKPYLRPMTSMTEEEKRKFVSLMNGSAKMTADEEHPKLVFDKTIAIRENGITTVLDYNFEAFDWLNKNMFDYRGLIFKGLVLEAPDGMYEIE